MSEAAAHRYTIVAIALHWAIALAIVFNVLLGWWMHDSIEEQASAARAFVGYQVHKSVGLTVLLLSLVRLGWRIAHPPPPLPAAMPGWEKLAAKATHWAFYALMVLVPLSGWIYVSAGWSHENDQPFSVPTAWFGLFRVPHLFGLEHAANDVREGVAGFAIETHELLVWATLALLALHVGAALKHWLIDRDEVLPQMAPGVPVLGPHETTPADPRRRIGLIASAALIALAAFGVSSVLTKPLDAAPTQSAEAVDTPAEATDAAAPAATTDVQTPATPAAAGAPAVWTVDAARSSIRFSGEQGGTQFNGRFSRWRAEIRFDPNNLDASSAVVTIETASASDGDPMHDEALPGPAWFDSANHPNATFRTSRIRHRGGNDYEARGTLTIKGVEQRIDMPFTLTVEGDRATMSGRASVDRREAGLGVGDAADDYVSREIAVTVRVEARRAP